MNTIRVSVLCRTALLFIVVMMVLAACGEQNTPPLATTGAVESAVTAATAPQTRPTSVASKPAPANNTTTGNPPTACALVNQQEAEAALGSPATVQSHTAQVMLFTECDYTVTAGEKRVRVELITQNAKPYFTKTKSDSAQYAPADVAGLGDQAFKYTENDGADVYLTVLIGDKVCRITVSNLADGDTQVTALMQKAVSRLTKGGIVQPTAAPPAAKKTTPVAAVTTAKSATNPADGIIHVCPLLTSAEAAVIIGGAVDQVDNSADGANFPQGSGTCNYINQSGGLTVKLNFSQMNQTDFEANMKDVGATPVAGIGDSAFWVGTQLTILKGTVNLVILPVSFTMDGATLQEKAKVIAQQIFGRLATTPAKAALTSTAAPVKKTTSAEVPVYPGSQLVKNDVTSFGTSSTYVSTDSYAKVTAWLKKALEDKGWKSTAVIESQPGMTIAVGGDASDGRTIQIIVSGPQKADRVIGQDASGNQIDLDPNSTMIEVHF